MDGCFVVVDACVTVAMSHAFHGCYDVACMAKYLYNTLLYLVWLQRLNSFTKLTIFVDCSGDSKRVYFPSPVDRLRQSLIRLIEPPQLQYSSFIVH